MQSDLYYSHLRYPLTSFICGFWDQNLVRKSTADNRIRGLTVVYIIMVTYTIILPGFMLR